MKQLCLVLLLAACGGDEDEGPAFAVAPTHGGLGGQVDVTLTGDFSSIGQVQSVTFAGISAYAIRQMPGQLVVTIQGAPQPGAADVAIEGVHGRAIRHHLFTFDAPQKGVPLRWAAFGASLTMGMESMGLDPESQVHGVAAQVAQAVGVWLALPLFDGRVLPPMQPSDFNTDCTQKEGAGPGSAFAKVLTNPTTGRLDLRMGRLDPTLPTRNFAIGGATVSEILHGVQGAGAILEHIVEDPGTTAPGDVFTPETVSQIDRIEKFDPDIALCADLLANDLDSSVTQDDDLHPDMITDLATVKPLLAEMMARLGKLHGQYFIANMPSLTFVPNVVDLRAKRIAAGLDTPQSFDAKAAQIDQLTEDYNAALADAMRPYPNLHLVDFKDQVEAVRDGIRIDGELLTVDKFGGLLSLDNLHFTDTGYALYANVFIGVIADTLHIALPQVDVSAVHAQDPLAPSKLRADGFTCVAPGG